MPIVRLLPVVVCLMLCSLAPGASAGEGPPRGGHPGYASHPPEEPEPVPDSSTDMPRVSPVVSRLVNAALRLADAEFSRGASWPRKVRASALLPEIRVTSSYDTDRDESLDRYQDRPDRWGADTDRDFGISVTATWNFASLVFHPEELDVQDALQDIAQRREEIIAAVVNGWFERDRLLKLRAIRPPSDLAARLEIEARILALTAQIDALTGGLLSRTFDD
ncbi:MAG TPA: hypothetical protein PLM00_09100 [Spirochaetota bacterium]|nr:hypothetical protein [Spirochaetota bacterium]